MNNREEEFRIKVLKHWENQPIHVPTRKEFNELMEILSEYGLTWNGGQLLKDGPTWKDPDTVYTIRETKKDHFVLLFNYEHDRKMLNRMARVSDFKLSVGIEPKHGKPEPKKELFTRREFEIIDLGLEWLEIRRKSLSDKAGEKEIKQLREKVRVIKNGN